MHGLQLLELEWRSPDPDQARGDIHRRSLLVANTHLHSDGSCKDVKLFQVTSLVRAIERLQQQQPTDALLVAGDFNSLPGSAVQVRRFSVLILETMHD